MKAAIYARVSDDKLTEEGARRQDVMRQVEKLKAWAERAGWAIPEDLIFIDDAKSAFKDDYNNRPAFVRLMRAIKAHWVDRVLIEDITRWYRNLEEGLRTLKQAAEAGCTITSTHEGDIDVTLNEDWMKASIALLFAEWASRIHAEKVRSGMKRREADKRKVCQSCNVVHIGRHPEVCACLKCRRRKGRAETSLTIKPAGLG